MTGSQLDKLCRKYALVQRHGQETRPRDDEQRRYVRRRDTDDGMVKIEVVVHPEEAELIWTMLNDAAKRLTVAPPMSTGPASPNNRPGEPPAVSAETRSRAVGQAALAAPPAISAETRMDAEAAELSYSGAPHVSAETRAPAYPGAAGTGSVLQQREDATRRAFNRAAALVSIAEAYVRGDRPNRAPIEILVTVAASSLREGAVDPMDAACMGASCLAPETARRLSCDAGVVDIREDEHGVPLSVGRKRRTIAGSIERALLKRDTACVFPGCTHSMFLEGHHIRHWADGGETSLENALLVCAYHHPRVRLYDRIRSGPAATISRPGRPRDPGGAAAGDQRRSRLGGRATRERGAGDQRGHDRVRLGWQPSRLRARRRSPRARRWFGLIGRDASRVS
jgi:hypothetical protein